MGQPDGLNGAAFNEQNGSKASGHQKRWIENFRANPFRFPGETTLFEAGEEAAGVYCLLKGAVKLQMRNQNGEAVTYFIARPYELLGFYDMFNSEATYSISVKTLNPVEVGFMEKSTYMRLLNDHPMLTYSILNQLHFQIKRMEQKMGMFWQESAQMRVIALLQELMKDFGIDDQQHLNLALSTEDIADLAGVSKTYMKKLLPRFRSDHLFETRRNHIRIIDPEQLRWMRANQGDTN